MRHLFTSHAHTVLITSFVSSVLGCSGNASLGGGGGDGAIGGATAVQGGASSLVAGSSSKNTGGFVGQGGAVASGGTCALQECFRAVECVQYCGGPVVVSGCCPCATGMLDRSVDCTGSGGSPATGGTSSASTYQPCAGKSCGSYCTLCPPNSTDCGETAVIKTCNMSGQCLAGTAQCATPAGGGSPSVGGAGNTGGKLATGGTSQGAGGNSATGGVVAAGGTGNNVCSNYPPTCYPLCEGGLCNCYCPNTGGTGAGAGGQATTGGIKASTGGTTAAGGVVCGTTVCGSDQDCCNASCSVCVPKGDGCTTQYCTTGGTSGTGGTSSTSTSTGIAGLHQSCTNDTCPSGLTAVQFYGVAGSGGPLFCSCEISCPNKTCPDGMQCTTISDGPGGVCY